MTLLNGNQQQSRKKPQHKHTHTKWCSQRITKDINYPKSFLQRFFVCAALGVLSRIIDAYSKFNTPILRFVYLSFLVSALFGCGLACVSIYLIVCECVAFITFSQPKIFDYVATLGAPHFSPLRAAPIRSFSVHSNEPSCARIFPIHCQCERSFFAALRGFAAAVMRYKTGAQNKARKNEAICMYTTNQHIPSTDATIFLPAQIERTHTGSPSCARSFRHPFFPQCAAIQCVVRRCLAIRRVEPFVIEHTIHLHTKQNGKKFSLFLIRLYCCRFRRCACARPCMHVAWQQLNFVASQRRWWQKRRDNIDEGRDRSGKTRTKRANRIRRRQQGTELPLRML